jgi:hypothetical protein
LPENASIHNSLVLAAKPPLARFSVVLALPLGEPVLTRRRPVLEGVACIPYGYWDWRLVCLVFAFFRSSSFGLNIPHK